MRTVMIVASAALVLTGCAQMNPFEPERAVAASNTNSHPTAGVVGVAPLFPTVPSASPVLVPEPVEQPAAILAPPPAASAPDSNPVVGPIPPVEVVFSCPVGTVPVLRDVITCEPPQPVFTCPAGSHVELRDDLYCAVD